MHRPVSAGLLSKTEFVAGAQPTRLRGTFLRLFGCCRSPLRVGHRQACSPGAAGGDEGARGPLITALQGRYLRLKPLPRRHRRRHPRGTAVRHYEARFTTAPMN